MSQAPGDHYQISVGGSVGGNVVVGGGNQIVSSPTTSGVTAADLAAFRSAIEALKTQVAAQAPEQAAEARAQLDDLHHAAMAAEPDLNTFERVRDWFVAHLPAMAGTVTGLLVHPVVGALVKSAGDAVVEDFHRRFGGASSAE